jgi:hypothetical protein
VGEALRELTRGELLKVMDSSASPSPLLWVTLTARTMLEDRPRESLTVRVRDWRPVEAGAVHEVEAAEGAEKEPAVALHAYERVSPGLGSWAEATREMEPPAATVELEATRESMRGASFSKGGGGGTCWRVMATRVVWFSEMVTPEAEPSKSRVPKESKAWAWKERLGPAGMLPMIPPQMPWVGARSTVTEGMSVALEVTETREISEERSWGTETANRAKPVLEGEPEQLASSTTVSANINRV